MDLVARPLFYALVLLFGTPMSAVQRGLTETYRRWRSSSWLLAQGAVHQSFLSESNHFQHAEISYWYSVNGEYYSGRVGAEFGTESAAGRFLSCFPSGQMLFVRYEANRPERSTLLRDDNPHLGA